MLGLSLEAFTALHVVISFAGILSGFVVLFGLMGGKRLDGWTAVFLVTTVLTSVTGFMFPFEKLLPSHKLGIISLVVLAVAIGARYSFHMAGSWRTTYVVGATLALYFNCFVLVVQSFEKVAVLKALAPTQTEPPFLLAQLVVLAGFLTLGTLAVVRFRHAAMQTA